MESQPGAARDFAWKPCLHLWLRVLFLWADVHPRSPPPC